MLIGLHGRKRVGKDTIADILCSRYGYSRLSFAGPIKDGLVCMFGIKRAQFEGAQKEQPLAQIGVSPRRLMQTLGTEWGRTLVRADLWIRLAEQSLQRMKLFTKDIVITDTRYEDEASWIRGIGGAVWHIHRQVPKNVSELPHSSEQGLAIQAHVDSLIDNSAGLEQLAEEVRLALDGERVVTDFNQLP